MNSAKVVRIALILFGVGVLMVTGSIAFVLYQFRQMELDKARKQTEPARMAKLAKLNGSSIEEIKTEANEI